MTKDQREKQRATNASLTSESELYTLPSYLFLLSVYIFRSSTLFLSSTSPAYGEEKGERQKLRAIYLESNQARRSSKKGALWNYFETSSTVC